MLSNVNGTTVHDGGDAGQLVTGSDCNSVLSAGLRGTVAHQQIGTGTTSVGSDD